MKLNKMKFYALAIIILNSTNALSMQDYILNKSVQCAANTYINRSYQEPILSPLFFLPTWHSMASGTRILLGSFAAANAVDMVRRDPYSTYEKIRNNIVDMTINHSIQACFEKNYRSHVLNRWDCMGQYEQASVGFLAATSVISSTIWRKKDILSEFFSTFAVYWCYKGCMSLFYKSERKQLVSSLRDIGKPQLLVGLVAAAGLGKIMWESLNQDIEYARRLEDPERATEND